jgi:WD40 repeat protein
MPTLKTQCPECDAKLRLAVDDEGEHELECPKCGHEFTATLEGDEEITEKVKKPKKAANRRDDDDEEDEKPVKKAKATRRRDEEDEDEDEDEAPRQKKRKKGATTGSGNTTLIVAAVVGGVLLLGGVGGLIYAFSGDKNAKKTDSQTDAKVQPPAPPGPPGGNPPGPKPPGPNQNPNNGPILPPPDVPAGGQNEEPNGGMPVAPPGNVNAQTEDVFARAASFKPAGPLPELPPLPPVERRPLLVLDPGGHTAFVRFVGFTPDASRVISVSEDKSVRIWDVASGEVLRTILLPAGSAHEGTLFAGAMSPDGKRLVVGGFPVGEVKSVPFYVLSVETGELLATVSGAFNAIHSFDFSPDGKLLAVGTTGKDAGGVQVYEFATKKWVYQAPFSHKALVKAIRFNPKRPLVLATVGADKEVKIWALDKPAPLAQIKLQEQGPNTVDWTSDGNTLAVGCTSGEMRTYDLAGKPLKTVPPLIEDHPRGKGPMQIARMRMMPDDKSFVFGGICYSGWTGVTEIATGKQTALVKEHTNTVAVNRSTDGALAVSAGGESNEIIVWDTKDGSIVRKFQPASKGLWAVGWGKDGKSLAWGSVNRTVAPELHGLDQTFQLDEFLPGDPPKPENFARHIRDDGKYAIKVEDFYNFTLFENGKPLYKHKCLSDRMYSVTLLPGKGIVVGASFGMYLLETKTGKLIREYRGDRGLTTALAPSPDGKYFVSGSTDQVLRVWAPDNPEPVLLIFACGREWIAWTPQGYYSCSPYGERLIAWQVNNGIDKLPTVHPAVRFRASLYQPALIKYLIPAGDMRLALAMAAKFDRQQIAATGLGDVLPPSVTVSVPQVADDKPITVRATAEGSDKNPIVAMRLLVDGRPFNGTAGVKKFDKLAKAEATWNVTLAAGSHTLAVLAESPVSKGMSQPAVVTRNGIEAPPNLYVLAVGVSAYPGNMKLNYAASDAILLTSTLQAKSKAVFGKIDVKLLTDKQGTKKNIREGLDWMKSNMTAKDVGIFFFSGHGGRDEDTDRFYLIPVDVGRDMERTCFAGDELKSRLEDMPGRLVAILDACHSGAVTEIKPAQTDNLVRDLMTDDYGVVVLASSLGRECSLESPLTKAGFYTLGLTEGMHGRADFNRDGYVYLNELEYYAALRVQQLSRGKQNPTMGRPPTIKPFPIAKP